MPRLLESVASNVHVRFDLCRFLFFFLFFSFLFFPPFSPPLTRSASGWRSRVAQLQRPGSARIATNAPKNVARENATEKKERERYSETRSVSFLTRRLYNFPGTLVSRRGNDIGHNARDARLLSLPTHPIERDSCSCDRACHRRAPWQKGRAISPRDGRVNRGEKEEKKIKGIREPCARRDTATLPIASANGRRPSPRPPRRRPTGGNVHVDR